MMDRRLTPANGRVAAADLRGRVDADRFVAGEAAAIAAPVADLRASPGGKRDRQLLLGAAVTVYDRLNGHAFVQAARDGYCGWVYEPHLGPAILPTHVVASRAIHAYTAPDIKSPEATALSCGAAVVVTGTQNAMAECTAGFIPTGHLRPVATPVEDPVAVALQFLGTAYLWGGNSAAGIDCSGLVQVAHHACGLDCPGDSDLQRDGLGDLLDPGTAPRRGDLYFWQGHVGLLSDPDTLLHANAHAMSTTQEPLLDAAARIAAQGGGPVLARRRVAL